MSRSYISRISLPQLALRNNMYNKRKLVSFDLEITARCNNNCRHCYINLPVRDKCAKAKEISLLQIKKIAEQAISLGSLGCLITGGEPLLRKDFFDIYMMLKKKGLLVSVFTNATLISQKHIKLFKKYPPRNIEVTVYGVTQDTYERITRIPGSFKEFMRGVDFLLKNNIKTNFKTMALRSNYHELPDIFSFCRKNTKKKFRFDPFLHFRFDLDAKKNKDITSERLYPQEVIAIEQMELDCHMPLQGHCDSSANDKIAPNKGNFIFSCGAGNSNFYVTYDGFFKLCSSLSQKDCVYDLKNGSVFDAWNSFVGHVHSMHSSNKIFLDRCYKCDLISFCMWCPAYAHLETRHLDQPVDYFCEVAHARAKALEYIKY